jgi:RimJ/RimL family protein N-acetyltransferase
MRIETERLLLRPLRAEDADAYAELIADPEVMRFIGGGHTGSRADAPGAIERINARLHADGFGLLGAERRGDGVLVGRVGLLVWDPATWRPGSRTEIGGHGELELGWALARAHWGRGYATEAATAVRAWADEHVRWGRLISLVHPQNARSIRVAERLGATWQDEVVTFAWGPARVYVHPPSARARRPAGRSA